MDIQAILAETVQWYWLIVTGIIGILLGALIAKQFGTDWLSLLAWAVGDAELEAFARILWNANALSGITLINTIKQVFFKNDIELWVKWVLAKAHSLPIDRTERMTEASRSLGYGPKDD